VSIFVVRHAKAGSRRHWDGDDDERPLSNNGRRQAAALAARLATEEVSGLWSSPSVRCVQTIEPLGKALDLEITLEPRLGEGERNEDALALLGEVPDGAVLCSHGDVIPELLQALHRRGTRIVGEPDWRKASLWVLDAPAADGTVATARAEPPPDA
jgi:8-oxo-dGTP diphosphatase